MVQAQKKDAEGFRQKIVALKNEPWLGTARSWWPEFLFHHTNIINAVEILSSGNLLSRSEVQARDISFADSGSAEILEQTANKWKDHVRFYFRPRSPTFYSVEGIRPKIRQKYNAHCPIPIYLLFDSASLLCLEGTKFSNGNLAARSGVGVYTTANEFSNLPFNFIYHDSEIPVEMLKKVTFHKNAEVIVPQKTDLTHLKRIWCRSQAEYDMLRYLVPLDIWQQWREKVTPRDDHSLFYHKWTYVNEVESNNKEIVLKFNSCKSIDAGPFLIKIEIIESATQQVYIWQGTIKSLELENFKQSFLLTNLTYPDSYVVKLYIDDNLVYAGSYQDIDDIPF